MNPITSARQEIADYLKTLFPDIPIYATWPNNVSTPCIIVSLKGAGQQTYGYWDAAFQITLIGPSGDNETAIGVIEDMLSKVIINLSKRYSQAISWDPPGQTSVANTVYLICTLEITQGVMISGGE